MSLPRRNFRAMASPRCVCLLGALLVVAAACGSEQEEPPLTIPVDANDGQGFDSPTWGDTSGGMDTSDAVAQGDVDQDSAATLDSQPLSDIVVDADAADVGAGGDAVATDATAGDGSSADVPNGDTAAGDTAAGPDSGSDTTVSDVIAPDGANSDGTVSDGTANDATGSDSTSADGASSDGSAGDGSAGDGSASDGSTSDGSADGGAAGDGTAGDGQQADSADGGPPCVGAPGCPCDPKTVGGTPCDDKNPCTIDSCAKSGANTAQGVCQSIPQKGPCDDGSKCTTDDACDVKTGVCAGDPVNAKVTCDDNKPCTGDTCHPTKGCQHTATAGTCDDGDPCTAGDVCNPVTGKCGGGKQTCSTCKADADCGKATNLCNGTLFCDLNASTPTCKLKTGSAVTCSQKGTSDCLSNSCDPKTGACTGLVNAPAGKGCDDGDDCTPDDACVGGSCTGFGKKLCGDKNPCTADSCDQDKGCVFKALTTTCDDGDACTVGDACAAGKCAPGKTAVCDDNKPCTKDACVKSVGCQYTAITGSCNDGDACTTGDICKGGVCSGVGVKCDDGNSCTVDSCPVGGGGCTYTSVVGTCNDGDACTTGEICKAKACGSGTKTNCDDNNPCTLDTCVAKTGCAHTAQAGICSDGDACTLGDTCAGGVCKPGTGKKVCDDKNPCTTDFCAAGVCKATTKEGAGCDDGDSCTTGDFCKESTCIGKAMDCSSLNGTCVTGSCAAGKCVKVNQDGAFCTDNNACTVKDACASGVCKSGVPKVCAGGSDCVTVACKTTTGACGASYVKAGTTCSKGVCDGKGACTVVCAPQSKVSLDGCSAGSFVAGCTSGCTACKPEGGFSATNVGGCGGKTCFAQVANVGVAGMVAMKTQPAETAIAEWKFGKTLCGKYRIYVDIPKPGSATDALCGGWNYVFAAKYLLREGNTTLESKTVNQAATLGTSVLLFERDMTGVTGVQIGNQAPPVGGCQTVLLDRLRAEPIP